jgi:2-polyprenyl-6-methoxyphenol hydroxylase-like FAD-dependent oxidoreductase
MRHTDIVIAGGGLAGSTAAAMLGRAGLGVVVVDPHMEYPPDFRCEKIDGPQLRVLRKTGLADAVLKAATYDGEVWVARFGRLVEKRPSDQHGILYHTLVNTVRAEIPAGAEFICAKVTGITTSRDRQQVTLSNGEGISARLVVVANGLNIGLRHMLGMERDIVAPCHSITIGFDIAPVHRATFEFPALTYYTEHPSDGMAFLTLFPIGSAMRANLFVYRDMRDPWLRQMRESPRDTLLAAMPGLQKLAGNFEVTGDVKIRPADLYVTTGYRQPGVVLVGDAFATSCPAAGTGVGKVFTDVERLCNVYIPRWLASDGMGEEKIAAFYDDPAKQAYDAHSAAKARYVRALSMEAGLPWRARRWTRFIGQLGVGALRQMRERLSARSHDRPGTPAGSGART